MQPLHFKVPRLKEETVRVECWELDNFFDPIHFHEEFQITLILNGEGTLFVGESVAPFKKGEIFLFGKNLPHVLRNNRFQNQSKRNKGARAISIFFNQDVIKKLLNEVPEAYAIERLIDFSGKGIKVAESSNASIIEKVVAMPQKKSFEKILLLLDILAKISDENHLVFLSPSRMLTPIVVENITKINKVFEYVWNNYYEKITLDQIAAMVNMSPTAFCRFFKQKSQKTFSRFLIEVRVANACRLLYQDDLNTSECCYSCGYNNLSNFHKHFKSVTGMTPLEYRNYIMNKVA
jgi:AraC-like DNA-binding protein